MRTGTLEEKRAALDVWRRWISGVFLGQSFDPVTRVLRDAVQTYDLREADFHAVIDGMEMDAGEPIIAPDLATLDLVLRPGGLGRGAAFRADFWRCERRRRRRLPMRWAGRCS